MKTEVHYWKVKNPQHYSAENFPVFYHATEPEDYHQAIYGTSAYEYPDLLKVLYQCLLIYKCYICMAIHDIRTHPADTHTKNHECIHYRPLYIGHCWAKTMSSFRVNWLCTLCLYPLLCIAIKEGLHRLFKKLLPV